MGLTVGTLQSRTAKIAIISGKMRVCHGLIGEWVFSRSGGKCNQGLLGALLWLFSATFGKIKVFLHSGSEWSKFSV